MKLKKIFIIIAAIFVDNVCSAQIVGGGTIVAEQKVHDAVQFSITSSNKVMVIGSTYVVQCRLHNSSTNRIACDNNSQPFLYGPRNGHVLLFGNYIHGLELANYSKTLEKHFVEAGETYDWNEPILIGKSIKPGHYDLLITKMVFMPALINEVGVNLSSEFQDIDVTQ